MILDKELILENSKFFLLSINRMLTYLYRSSKILKILRFFKKHCGKPFATLINRIISHPSDSEKNIISSVSLAIFTEISLGIDNSIDRYLSFSLKNANKGSGVKV